jgi:hypothetical protein
VKRLFILIILIFTLQSHTQDLNGKQLLEKAIQYHDPNGNWKYFKGNLFVTMETPKNPNRDSEIFIDIPNEYFLLKATQAQKTIEYIIKKDSITIAFNGELNPSEEVLKENRLSESRAKMLKNYYTYLYGLPMKLNDSGTIIHDEIENRTFKGKDYLVLKATYKEDVGKDTWYFYFNKETFRMEVYQFFHDESKNDGEYILLSGEEIINDIKMPKIRAWYTNKDNTYLGTDILKASK